MPGGKLVAVEATQRKGRLAEIKITGDFFMHPETAITVLEESLIGAEASDAGNKILSFFSRGDVKLVGASPDDFVHVLALSLNDQTLHSLVSSGDRSSCSG